MNKITIIGTGSVGSTIAYTLAINGTASEIVMIDINGERAIGESLDIRQGTPFSNPCSVYAGTYSDAVNSNIVIISSGVARKPGQSRLDLAQTNVDILRTVTAEITKYAPNATYVIVSNPVDVLTYAFCKYSGMPEERIIGSGTILDTSRLRSRLSEYYSINQRNVHAYVLGEHGDSSFVPWSIARVGSVPLARYHDLVRGGDSFKTELNYEEIEQYMRTSGGKIIARKGATFYAIAMSVCHICDCIFSNASEIITLSSMMHGEYGIDDVCLSVPTILNGKGMDGKLILPLTEEELGKLRHSSDVLKDIISQVEI